LDTILDAEFLSKIKLLAPGTKLRKALDDIVMAKLGTIVVFVDSAAKVKDIVQGGFQVDTPFTPEKLYELSKMDGAIIVDQDIARFYFANVHLIPEASIPSSETGIRHRTAERVARQTGELVVAVSARRNVITAYYKTHKHIVNTIAYLVTKIGRALSVLEKHRENLAKMIRQVDNEEFNDSVSLEGIAVLIVKFLGFQKIRDEIEPYIIEIGVEGKLSNMQLHEIIGDLDEQLKYFMMDYAAAEIEESKAIEMIERLRRLKEPHNIDVAEILGHEAVSAAQIEEKVVTPRGYRLLVLRAGMPMNISKNVIQDFENMSRICAADVEALKTVEGIGVKRANHIIESIRTMKNNYPG
jgi:diadenylate cyclase